MPLYLRNLQTGAIKTVDPQSDEFAKLKAERTDDGRFPIWEQTSAADADPDSHSSDYERENRGKWDHANHDVTTDGVVQSGPGQLAVGEPERAELATASSSSSSSKSSSKS